MANNALQTAQHEEINALQNAHHEEINALRAEIQHLMEQVLNLEKNAGEQGAADPSMLALPAPP